MFGSLGGPELILILVLALLLFGPRKLPEIGRTLGRGLAEFRKSTTEFKRNLQQEVDLEQVRQARDSFRAAGREVGEAVTEAGRLGVARGTLDEEPLSATDRREPATDGEPQADAKERRES